jgi:hypothetical protein
MTGSRLLALFRTKPVRDVTAIHKVRVEPRTVRVVPAQGSGKSDVGSAT